MPFNSVVTPAQLKIGELIPPGWYPAVFAKYEEKPASTDGSTNAIMTFEITEGPCKSMNAGVLANEKAMGTAKNLWNFWKFPKDTEGNLRVSDDMIKSKLNSKCKIYIQHTESKGKKYNTAIDFLPLDAVPVPAK